MGKQYLKGKVIRVRSTRHGKRVASWFRKHDIDIVDEYMIGLFYGLDSRGRFVVCGFVPNDCEEIKLPNKYEQLPIETKVIVVGCNQMIELPKIKEMTIEQVEKELGYKIKIIE